MRSVFLWCILLSVFCPGQEESDRAFQIIEVQVLSNWGHPDYTCMYRFRVHGTPGDLWGCWGDDIRLFSGLSVWWWQRLFKMSPPDNSCSPLLLPVPETPNTFLFLFLTLKQYSWRLETDGSSGFWVVWKNTDSVSLQSFHILEFQYVHPAGAGDTSVLSDQMLCQRDVISCGKMTHWQLWCDV